jgi:acetyl esterase/lipase
MSSALTWRFVGLAMLAALIAFLALAVAPPSVLAQPAAAPALAEIEVQRALVYATHDSVALQGDLYTPKGAGPYPVVIAVHGGGWQVGARAAYGSWGHWLAARGIAVFAVSYRLAKPGQPTYRQAVGDVRAAVQYIKGRAGALKLDADKVALMGDSAGAHLAALVALAGDDEPFNAGYRDDPFASSSTKVKAVIGAYGVYDMAQQYAHDLSARPQDSIVGKFLGAALWDNRRLYFEASPQSYATSANKAVSFLLTYGTEDDIVDRTQSDGFLLALKQAGGYARNVVQQGAGHFWFTADPVDDPRGVSAQFAPKLLRFLQERL